MRERVHTDVYLAARQEGVILGDPWSYNDGTTAERLRSGVDGPHGNLADRLCGLSTYSYERLPE